MPDSPPLNPKATEDAQNRWVEAWQTMSATAAVTEAISAYLSALPECASLDERLALARFVAPEAFEALERIAGEEFPLYFSERMRSCAKAALRGERYEWSGSA